MHLTGNGADLSRKANLVMADGSRASLDFMVDPNTGELILTGGTINGKPMVRPSLQNVIYSMQSGGMKNFVLSQNAGGSGGASAHPSTARDFASSSDQRRFRRLGRPHRAGPLRTASIYQRGAAGHIGRERSG